jgi:serine/threonine-protein kinase
MLTSGALIAGKYRVVRKLGEGAMGSVWLAKNEVTDREFAIKTLLPQAASAPAAFERFFREAKICGSIRHPSILEIYDAGRAPELDDTPFLVMELLDGAPLDVVLAERGSLPPRFALDIVAQLARGLHLAHQKNIVHRDLKPANVFLHRPGTGAVVPKVLDFGISKIVSGEAAELRLTQTAAILGSPLYMSPEQMDAGKAIDARSDVHALGILLWECLVGHPPFVAESYNALVCEIMVGPRPKLSDSAPALSPRVGALVERAFAIAAGDRFPSAAALAEALEAELAALGGGVLSGRDAAQRLLGSLPIVSRAPPPLHGSTNRPLSVDPPLTAPEEALGGTARLPLAPTQVSPSVPRSPDGPAPREASVASAPVRQSRGAAGPLAGVGLAAIALAGVALFLGSRGASPSASTTGRPEGAGLVAPAAATGASGVPRATGAATEESPPTPVPSASVSASPSATGSAPAPSPAASSPARSSAAAPLASAKKAPPRPAAASAAPATPSRVPRIDESGL